MSKKIKEKEEEEQEYNDNLIKWHNNKRKRSNESMHINNYYRYNPPNFKLLANKYPSFDKFIINKTENIYNIDWKDSNATKELTRVLLDHDFGLKIELPNDHLCPTITLRINYLYWLYDQLKLIDNDNNNKIVRGIDIGTGASCIFPLLGVKLFKNWSFIGIDIDDKVLEYAKNNIDINSLDSKIKLFKNDKNENDNILLNLFNNNSKSNTSNDNGSNEDNFDFCLCNPPFFNDLIETNINHKSKCTGSINELVTNGGEFEFIKKIIQESFILKSKIKVYSTMIGRKLNLNPLINILKKQYSLSNNQISTTELVQGNTSRWVLSWWFTDNNQNNQTNNEFLTRLERRKLYREGLLLNLNNSSNSSEISINSLKLILKENNILNIIEKENEFHCKYLLCKVVPTKKTTAASNKTDSKDNESFLKIEFLFKIFINNDSILFKPIEVNENDNDDDGEEGGSFIPAKNRKEIINSNLYLILKFLEKLKNELNIQIETQQKQTTTTST